MKKIFYTFRRNTFKNILKEV